MGVSFSARVSAANLLKNPSFEADADGDGLPDHWIIEEWHKKRITRLYHVDREITYSGKSCVAVETFAGHPATWTQWYQKAAPSKTYTAHVWAKSERAAPGSGLICDDGEIDGKRPWAMTKGTHDWKLLTITGIRPKGRRLIFTLVCRGGKMWFDEALLVEEGRPMPAVPARMAEPEGTYLKVERRLAADGKTVEAISVENSFYRTELIRQGGRIYSLYSKLAGREVAIVNRGFHLAGLAKQFIPEDHSAVITKGAYDLELKEVSGGADATARFAIAEGDWRGVTLRRTLRFREGTPAVEVEEELSSEQVSIKLTPRAHHYLNIARTFEGDYKLYCEAEGKLRVSSLNRELPSDYYIENVSGNWIGVTDREGNAFAAIVEEGEIDKFYSYSDNKSGTIEWFYKPTTVAPGKPWRTRYVLILARGVGSLAGVSREMLFSLPVVQVASVRVRGAVNAWIKEGDKSTASVPIVLEPGRATSLPVAPVTNLKEAAVEVTRDSTLFASVKFSRKIELYPRGLGPDDPPESHLHPMKNAPAPKPAREKFVFYHAGNYDDRAYFSPDMPSFLIIGQASSLTRKGTPSPLPKLVIDLPAEVEIVGGRYYDMLGKEKIERGAKPYIRHTIASKWDPYKTNCGNNNLICSTTLGAGNTFPIYYRAVWQGGEQPWQRLEGEVVHITKTRPPKRMHLFFDTFGTLSSAYPDYAHLRDLGFNAIGGMHCGPQTYRVIAEKCKKAGIDAMLWNFLSREKIEDAAAHAVDINGKRLPGLCPTYRGRALQVCIERGKEMIDAGILLHIFDPERFDGAQVCFCDRCVEQFRKFLAKRHKDLAFNSPREFVATLPNLENPYRRVWLAFKAKAYADLHLWYRIAMEAYVKEKDIRGKFRMHLYACEGYGFKREDLMQWKLPVIERSMEDARELARAFDYQAPMLYIGISGRQGRIDMLGIHREIKGMNIYSEGKASVVPTVDTGFAYCGDNASDVPPVAMRYQVLEALASGARGVGLYSEGMFDALDMKYWAEGVARILPVEEMFLQGKPVPQDRLVDIRKETFVKGVALGDEAVVLVSEYSDRPRIAEVQYLPTKSWQVVDLATGKKVAVVTPKSPTFHVELRDDRARLFHLRSLR